MVNMSEFVDQIQELIAKYPKSSKTLAYGTAGFRDRHDLPLNYVFVRMGILGVIRSSFLKSKSVGVMITASHNPEIDNGIKLVDSDGGMLSQSWEPYAVRLANSTIEDFITEVFSIIKTENVDLKSFQGVVVIGKDTRAHSPELANCVKAGVLSIGGICHDLGEVTTPQLHFTVHHMNKSLLITSPVLSFNPKEWLLLYNKTMLDGFISLLQTAEDKTDFGNNFVVLDASYGVGSILTENFILYTKEVKKVEYKLQIELRNLARSGPVNEGCGAELVQKGRNPPSGVSPSEDTGKLISSFDGDGDRIVFHGFLSGFKESSNWVLMDGDKIAALFAKFLLVEMQEAGLDSLFSLGCVQTAYANGASTNYLKKEGINTAIAKTGVKYVHHKALEYDIGVYFEANGHGTVLFSPKFVSAVEEGFKSGKLDQGSRKYLAFQRLQASILLINPAVGDAMSDMLFCLACLQVLGLNIRSWNEMYKDLPSKQKKVAVPDKNLITCSETETDVITPVGMQEELSKAMKSVNQGRCFVRPSGTEDVVRIYAEAETEEEADKLCDLTNIVIEKFLGKV